MLLFDAGQLDEALEQHQEELMLCQALGDSIGEGVAHRRMGEVYCELGQLEEALCHHQRFLEAAEQQQDRLEIQRATATVGRTYLLQADNISSFEKASKDTLLGLASKFFQRSLEVVPSVMAVTDRERAEMTARLHLNLGIVAESGGDTQQARASYSTAAALTAEHDLPEVGRRVHDTVALSFQSTGDYSTALLHLQASLRLAEKLQDRTARADILHSRAQVQLCMGDRDTACRTWYKAYKLHSPRESDHKRHARCLRYAVLLARAEEQLAALPLDDHQGRHDRHEQVGDWLCRLSAFRRALQHYQAQLECAEKLGNPECTKSPIYASLAQTHKDLRQFADAKRWFLRELDSRHGGNPAEVCKTLMNLASLESSTGGDVDSVCRLYRRAAVEAGSSGLLGLRTSALRDLADTYREHGRAEEEASVRDELAVAGRADSPQLEDDQEEEEEEGDSSSGDEPLDPDVLEGLSSGQDETEEIQRPRRRRNAAALWRNNKGETHLHVACIQGKLQQVGRLLSSGHPVNVRDHSGWLPLHEAANFGHTAVVEQLLRHGAHVNDPGGRHCGGVTPLHDAAGNGHLDVVKRLLAAGADPGAANEQGQTPLQYLMHYRAQCAPGDLGAEALAAIGLLEQEMKEILTGRGHPIPSSPGACLSQSPSVRSARSSSAVPDDSEGSPPPPAAVVIVSDEEEHPAAAYRRAIRGVGQSAVTAPAAGGAGRRPASGDGPAARCGLVSEAQYQWLEQDTAEAPPGRRRRRRRRRRLSSVFASAGSGDGRRDSPPAGGGARPVSPLWHGETSSSLPPQDPESVPLGTVGEDAGGGRPLSSDSEPETSAVRRRPKKRQRQARPASPVAPTERKDGWSAGQLRVYVEVERDRLMVPVPAAGRPCSVQWLAEQASERYYKQFLLRPRLELLKDGALLTPQDAVEGLLRGQEDVLGSRVLSWERPPLPERYSSACEQLGQRPVSAVSARLGLCQGSGRLSLAELQLSSARLRPVLHAIQRYSCITHLLLAGNPLRDAGALQLSEALTHLPALRTLDLSGAQLTAGGLAHLAAAARRQQQAPLGCTALLLGYNLLADVSAGPQLAALMSLLPRLDSVDLTSCQLTERHLAADGGALCRTLADCHLTELRLAHNRVSAGGAGLLLRSLRPDWLLRLSVAGWRGVPAALVSYVARSGQCCLQELDLRHCRLTDRDADLLASALSACRRLSLLDLSQNSALSSRGVSVLLDAAVASDCPLSQLNLAGCGGGGGAALTRLLTGPAPLRRLSLPAAGAEPAAQLWRRRKSGQGSVHTSPDGYLTMELTAS